jgi:hypothetical protein
MTFEELFIKHGAASFDKQIYLQAMLGKAGWGLDLATGVLAFRRPHEATLQLNVQVIGTESDDSNTWLWGWANAEQGYRAELLLSSLEVKVQGDRLGVPELTTPELPLTSRVNGARIAAIASGICRAGCYFRAPYPRGVLYLLVRDPRFKRPVSQPIQRIMRAFPMFLSDNSSIADQRGALLSYLQFYKLDVEYGAQRIVARSHRATRTTIGKQLADALVAEFDDSGRLVSLSELVTP